MREIELTGANLCEIATEILSRGGSFQFKGHGWSMYPFIRDGAVITVSPVQPHCLRVGDVVLCNIQSVPVVHRIVAKGKLQGQADFRIRGDVFSGPGEELSSASVMGRVVKVQQRGWISRPDSFCWRWAGVAWVRLTPMGQWCMRAASTIHRLFKTLSLRA